LLYLYKKYAENEIERAKRAEHEWFDEVEAGEKPGEKETGTSETDEGILRKEDEGIPGEEKPASGEP
jgi:hypothetical protein